jgi:RNA polymerase sigma-32 factor
MTPALILKENNLEKYMSEVRKYPLLSREEEHLLATRYRDTGDIDAAHRLVVSNLRFVVKVAHEFRGYGMRLLDLIQEGNIGLMVAVKKFDPNRGYRLISYAVWWIRAYMKSFALRGWSTVKVGTTEATRRLFFSLRKAKAKLTGRNGAAPTKEELAGELGVDVGDVEEMELRLAARDFSLDAEAPSSGGTRLDALPSREPTQEERYADEESRALVARSVESALGKLTDKERYIVEQRFMADPPKTLNEIGEELGVTRERVRQLEARAIAKIRKELPKELAA